MTEPRSRLSTVARPTDLASILRARVRPALGVVLPASGRVVSISSFLRLEERATQPLPRAPSCWAPNKPAVMLDGVATWPEYVLLRLLERAGWEGRWIKNWGAGREFCIDLGHASELPGSASRMFASIHERAEALGGAGSWDVFAWNGSRYLFIESKQHRSSDRLSDNQCAWLEAALDQGVASDCFAVVEYDAGPPLRRSPR